MDNSLPRDSYDAPLTMGKAKAQRLNVMGVPAPPKAMDRTNNASFPRMRGREAASKAASRATAQSLGSLLFQPRVPSDSAPLPKIGGGLPSLVDNPFGSSVPKRAPSVFSQNSQGINPESFSMTQQQLRFINATNAAKAHNDEYRREHLTRFTSRVRNNIVADPNNRVEYPPSFSPFTAPTKAAPPQTYRRTVTADDELVNSSSEDDTSATPSLVASLLETIGNTPAAAKAAAENIFNAAAYGARDAPSAATRALEARIEALEAARAPSLLTEDISVYNGDNMECSICIARFEAGQRVCRLQCYHVFHAPCWLQGSQTLTSCPNCRAPARIIASWNWVARGTLTQGVCIICNAEAPDFEEVERGAVAEPPPPPLQNNSTSASSSTVPLSLDVSEQQAQGSVPSPALEDASRLAIVTPVPGLPLSRYAHRVVDNVNIYTPPTQQSEIDEAGYESVPDMDESFITMGTSLEDVAYWHQTPSGSLLDRESDASASSSSSAPVYHTETRLADGRLGLVVDPGSVCNLSGGNWALEVAKAGLANGRKPDQKARDRPLQVSGVGHGSQQATHNVILPICLAQEDGSVTSGTFVTPSVTGSDLPGLLGLTSLQRRRAVLDMVTNKLYFLGPGDYKIESILPPGSETYQLHTAPSGHLLLPVDNYKQFDKREMEGSLTLDSQPIALHTQAKPE